MLVALGLGVHAAFERPELGLFGLAGAVVVGVAVALGQPVLVVPGVVLAAAGYAARLLVADADQLDAAAALVACALLLIAELAYWSVELRSAGRVEGRVVLRRLVTVVVLAATSLALAAAVLAATAIPSETGVEWNVVGVVASAAVAAMIVVLTRGPAHSERLTQDSRRPVD